MRHEERLWQTVALAAVLLTAFVPGYVTYEVYRRGPSPEKRVEVTTLSTINPMKGLGALGDRITFTLRVEEQTLNNLFISYAFLRNTGSVPIVPTDYHENLSVNVPPPWKIVSVEALGRDTPRGIVLRWKRASDTRFEAEPALLNPGDMVSTTIYLTNTSLKTIQDVEKEADKEPTVEWKTRITNLRELSSPPPKTFTFGMGLSPVYVYLRGASLAFTVVGALLFQALYLLLLDRAGLVERRTWQAVVFVLGASFLSFAAAESSATYIFGDPFTHLFGGSPNHWLNAPWIVAHAVVVTWLYWRTRRRAKDS